jgi:hypothetical protein
MYNQSNATNYLKFKGGYIYIYIYNCSYLLRENLNLLKLSSTLGLSYNLKKQADSRVKFEWQVPRKRETFNPKTLELDFITWPEPAEIQEPANTLTNLQMRRGPLKIFCLVYMGEGGGV